MILKPNKDINIVIYDNQKIPKCFTIKKTKLKVLITFLSFTIAISLYLAISSSAYFIKGKSATNELHLKTKTLEEQQEILEQEKLELTKMNSALTDKVKTIAAQYENKQIKYPLQFFNLPAYYQNITSKNLVKTSNENQFVLRDTINFQFNIENLSDMKQSGYIFVLMIQNGLISIYPSTDISSDIDNSVIHYTKGESFLMSKLRPSEAVFPKLNAQGKRYFKIFIFSKSGDLIYTNLFGPY